MKTMTKVMTALGLVLCLGLATAIPAKAEIPSDSFTITLTATGERGVIIDTPTIVLTGLLLGATTYTAGAQGVVVISTGSVAPIEYSIGGVLSSGWNLSTNGYATAENEVAVHALFKAAAPGRTDFEGTDILRNLLGAPAEVGDGAGALDGKYEGDQDMDSMPLNASRNLWFQIKLPVKVNTLATQTITVTVTAEAPE